MDNKNKELTCNSCKRFRDNMLNDICDAGQWTRMLNPSTCQYFSSKKTTNEKTKPMIKFKKEVNEMEFNVSITMYCRQCSVNINKKYKINNNGLIICEECGEPLCFKLTNFLE